MGTNLSTELRRINFVTVRNVVDLMGLGLILKISKDKHIGELVGLNYYRHIAPILLPKEVTKEILEDWQNRKDNKIVKELMILRIWLIEEGDFIHDGRLVKKGWRSMGLDGEKFDYYRMVQ